MLTSTTKIKAPAKITTNKQTSGEKSEILLLLKNIDYSIKRLDRQQRSLKAEVKIIQRYQQHTHGQIKKIILNQNTQPLPKQQLPKTTLPGSSVDECIHGEVLQENIRMLVKGIDLSNGFITDEMLATGCLTDEEVDELKDLGKQDKIRKLISVLGRKNKRKFSNFLEIISKQEFYPHVAKSLKTSYEKKLQENQNVKHSECIHCFLVQNVEIRRIVDCLCEHQFIRLSDFENFIKGGKNNKEEFWLQVFQKISDPICGESNFSVFKDALRDHYPHIARKIECRNHLKCCCHPDILSYPSGSVGDSSEISTTTTVIPNTKPETCRWVENTCNIRDLTEEIQEADSEILQSEHDGNFTQILSSAKLGTNLEYEKFNTGKLNVTANITHHTKTFRSRSGRRHVSYLQKPRFNKNKYTWINSNAVYKPFDNKSKNRKRSYNNAFVANEADRLNVSPSTKANFGHVQLENVGENQFRLSKKEPDKRSGTVRDGKSIFSKEQNTPLKKPIPPRSALTYVRERGETTASKMNKQLSNFNQQKAKFSQNNHTDRPTIIRNDIRVTVNREQVPVDSTIENPKIRRVNYSTDPKNNPDHNKVEKKPAPRKTFTLPFKRYEDEDSHGRRE
ncbi:uncharacterized protein LOC134245143 [Saccostrea cucullata]|uniref:uncharacterized protein LOC134245143 n=1 Tax=Saccostrea cuccullata TaxID=36930 RepID=UPI002ED1C3AD